MLPAATTHIIWDWNGTLLNDTDLVLSVMNSMLDTYSLPSVDMERYRRIFDFPVEGYYRALGFTDAHDSFTALATQFIQSYDERVPDSPLHNGATEVLNHFNSRGISQSILTAAEQRSVEQLLDHHGVRHFIEYVVGLDNHYAGGKLERGLAWIRSNEIDTDATVLIGDTVHDYEVAESLGVQCLLVADGHNSEDRLRACGCPVVQSLHGLFENGNATKRGTLPA